MNPPLVSVVIPVYNCEAYVGEAVQSALDQDHPNIEVIVVDDGSRDGSVDVLKRFGDRIRLIQVRNGGPARARNAAMAVAKGRYLAFLDADDVWLPGKVSAQVAYLEAHPDTGACYTEWSVWKSSPGGDFSRPEIVEPQINATPTIDPDRSGWIYSRLLFDCELLTTTVMLRTSVAASVGHFDPSLSVGEDYDLWLRLSQSVPIARLQGVQALYRVVANSASRKANVENHELKVVRQAVSRFGLSAPFGPSADPALIEQRFEQLAFQHAYLHLQLGDPRIARDSFAASVRRHPLRPRLWAHFLIALVRSAGNRSTTAVQG